MSCTYCNKYAANHCQKEGCSIKTCDLCKNQMKIGGSKWVQCQNSFQYYCNSHLVRQCMQCDDMNTGCGTCLKYRLLTTCCSCDKPYYYCNTCENDVSVDKFELVSEYVNCGIDNRGEKTMSDQTMTKCGECFKYFCSDTCGEMVSDGDEFSCVDIAVCHQCANTRSDGRCRCWKCK